MNHSHFFKVLQAAVYILALSPGTPAEAEPIKTPTDAIRALAGRWTANAAAQWLNGTVDRFTCVITHFNDASQTYRHTWRCEKEGIKIELLVSALQTGDKLTGTWEEKVYGLSGSFAGKATINGWSIVGRNRFGFAAIDLAHDGCRGTVEIVPSEQIKKVVAKMAKC